MRRTRKLAIPDAAEAPAKDAPHAASEAAPRREALGKTEAPQRSEGQQKPGRPRQSAQGKAAPARNNNKNNNRQNAGGTKQNNGSYNKNANANNANNANGNNHRRQRRPHQGQSREVVPSVSREELAKLKVADLRAKAAELPSTPAGLKKAELVEAVFDASVKAEGFNEVAGVLDILADGYGFLRTQGYLPSETDCLRGAFHHPPQRPAQGRLRERPDPSRRARTRSTRPSRRSLSVNGAPIEQCGNRPRFADLTPVYPDERLWMEHGKQTVTARVIDLAAPIGKGQRGLIVSPPKAGKTTHPQGHRGRHHREQPRGAPHVPARGRASRGGDRHAALHARARSSPPRSTCRARTTSPCPSWSSSAPSAWWKAGPTWSSCSTPSRASPAPTTWRSPRRDASCPAAWTPRRSIRPSAFWALPATSRAAAA